MIANKLRRKQVWVSVALTYRFESKWTVLPVVKAWYRWARLVATYQMEEVGNGITVLKEDGKSEGVDGFKYLLDTFRSRLEHCASSGSQLIKGKIKGYKIEQPIE